MRDDFPQPIGFGTAPLGNMNRAVPEEQAQATLQATWDNGIRMFDTAPHYGTGLAEIRLGDFLSQQPRDEYFLCTKVGRLITDERIELDPGDQFGNGRALKKYFDYSADGTLRSIEQSLERLKTDQLDVVWIHDVSEDMHGPAWEERFDEAMNGAAQALTRLREEGVIRGWGLGVNLVEPCLRALDRADPDAFLQAGRYSLLDHHEALDQLFPRCEERDIKVVMGGTFNSGILAGGELYEYAPAPQEKIEQTRRLQAVCDRFGVDLKAAALQFSGEPEAVQAQIPGATRPERIAENLRLFNMPIPDEFWVALKEEQLIPAHAPIPRAASRLA
ncbi:D-threo-aldose 1-dehydrogenase [Kushneria sinocarnis]|uniref:D-threo-aldose 1-dehydrogenase n=1 Tax=Kushneria sinocarnis TaxID=595502 RepID=A0A420WV10_9GAMM|nr:aldo/keto reductase [Kushneria sinocarnis]RKR02411.1 D-threo-aldose 1-dehydrogenase [Kushneria sinocarnis]